jgi:hypothetical protein
MRKGLRRMKKGVVVLISLVSLFLIVAGCANYGRLRLESGPGETITVQKLVENWENYDVLATGVEPNVPSAIIFAPKNNDGRKVIGERWWELDNQKSIANTVGWIKNQNPLGPYYPRLWRMLGPDGHLYGYMYTSWDSAVMIVGPDKTMKVLDIPVPPYQAVGASDARSAH